MRKKQLSFIENNWRKYDEKLKLKNIKDLEYNHLLNKQNVLLIVFATAAISVVLSDNLPEGLTKWGLVFTCILSIILSLLYYGKKLEEKLNEIKKV